MRAGIAIAKRETLSWLVTPRASILISGFLLVSGYLFFSILGAFNDSLKFAALTKDVSPSLNQLVIAPYFHTVEVILLFLLPILTAKVIAGEWRTSTADLLFSSSAKLSEIVFGKYLGLASVVILAVVGAFFFPVVLCFLTELEVAPLFVGFLGLTLFALSFVSLGLLFSAAVKNETLAALLSMIFFLLLYAADAPAKKIGGTAEAILGYISPAAHSEYFFEGVIRGTDLLYFFSLIAFGLFFSHRILETKRVEK